MKTEYLKAKDVAEELRCSTSRARDLIRDEMTCLAIGQGVYRTRVVERAEFERWKQRQIEPPQQLHPMPPVNRKKTVHTLSCLPPDVPLDKKGWPLPPTLVARQRAQAEAEKVAKAAAKKASRA